MKLRFTTGELARLHGVSKQTLIFYDKAGVFCPREKDPHNGYRYYTEDQLELLDHILMLKDMGMSLQDIRAFLTLPDMGGTETPAGNSAGAAGAIKRGHGPAGP